MKDKLTISDLSPYLPYELQMVMQWPNNPHEIGRLKSVGLHPGAGSEDLLTVFVEFEKDNSRQIIYKKNAKNPICKPLLMPLTALNAAYCFMVGYINKPNKGTIVDVLISDIEKGEITVPVYNKLLSWHFDVFNLISDGLAINNLENAE